MAKGRSLHIGLNSVDSVHYGGWSGPLNACEADAEDMQALAQSEGFSTELLLTEAATREAVTGAIGQAAESLQEGDIFFVSYSGHGGQVPDINSDEPDAIDETWCLFDAELLDDEVYVHWARFPRGVRILVLSDSCHSGTVTRAPFAGLQETVPSEAVAAQLGVSGARYRVMPQAIALKTYRRNREFYDALQRALPADPADPEATIRLISGCQDNQLSLDGSFNGLFTGQLLRVWDSGAFQGDYAKFHSEVLLQMPSTQSPNHFVIGPPNPTYDAQRPFAI